MVKRILLGAVLVLPSLAGFAGEAKLKGPDCYCTDTSGLRVELGETVCLTVDGRTYEARCEMMLNNPMWREVGSGCTVSQRDVPRPGTKLALSANG